MSARSAPDDDVSSRQQARVDDAIAELADLRSSDPAARSALHALKLTQFTLETWWHRRAPAPDDPVA